MNCCAYRRGLMKTRFSQAVFWPMLFGLSNGFVRNLQSWRVGDSVLYPIDNNPTPGIVQEDRGRGWYSVLLSDTNATIKCRGRQLVATTNSTIGDPTSPINDGSGECKSTLIDTGYHEIHDLDAALREAWSGDKGLGSDSRLEQIAHHASYEKWVVFTDLHCAPSTLDVCLEVLSKVHNVAASKGAGVLFLGDFWHHRGVLRVDCLNAVLANLRTWTVPLVLIPGNHDQITLGGRNHGLTPLENAYMLKTADGIVPGPLVLSYPTKFRNALFIPHIRDVSAMESILQSPQSQSVSSLFVHAEVTGAYMNDLIVCQGGVSPSSFPPNKHIYSGHFHKPHTVQSGRVAVEYLGSPYETSLAEAHQSKSLAVLDSAWRCLEYVPLNIGRKHFKVSAWEDLLKLKMRAPNTSPESGEMIKEGDRVVVTVSNKDAETIPITVSSHIKALRQGGATVEIREVQNSAEPIGMVGAVDEALLDEMAPKTTWNAFLTDCVRRDVVSDEKADMLSAVGLELLDEVQIQDESSDQSPVLSDLQLASVTVEGFGPFKECVTYPLLNRGLVLLRGTNSDGGFDSNGTGKSSLAMAALWALTGSLDDRRVQDARTIDVINDDSKVCQVTVHGKINGSPFTLVRSKSRSKGDLVFEVGGIDVTTQSVKETQALVDEKLGISSQILSRTVFYGQHSLNELLEATDAKFKEELSLVVPIALWQEAAKLARARARDAARAASELTGMIALRTGDIEKLRIRKDNEEKNLKSMQEELNALVEELENESLRLGGSEKTFEFEFNKLELRVHEAADELKNAESKFETLMKQREEDVGPLERSYEDLSKSRASLIQRCQDGERETFAASLKVDTMKEKVEALGEKWDVDLSDGLPDGFITPELCPTCQQPLSDDGKGHSHRDLQILATRDIEQAFHAFKDAQLTLDRSKADLNEANKALSSRERTLKEMEDDLSRQKSRWATELAQCEQDVATKRAELQRRSDEFSVVARKVQQFASSRTLETKLSNNKAAITFAGSALEALETELCEGEYLIANLTSQLETENRRERNMMDLGEAFGQRGVQTYVLKNVVDTLQLITEKYLDELSEGAQRLQLSLDAGDRISRTPLIQGSDGDYRVRPLSTLSGGQWRRCSLALSFAFAELLARRGKLRPSLCILDEPLTHLDRVGRTKVGHLIRKMLRPQGDPGGVGLGGLGISTIVLILQDLAAEELEESFDSIDEVEKKGGASIVKVDIS